MVIALDTTQKIPIVVASDLDKPEEQQTIFYMRPLSAGRVRSLFAEFHRKKEKDFSTEDIFNFLGKYLVGWRNFKDAQGKEIVFKMMGNTVDPEMWEYFSMELVSEVFNAMLEAARIGSATLKNSGSEH